MRTVQLSSAAFSPYMIASREKPTEYQAILWFGRDGDLTRDGRPDLLLSGWTTKFGNELNPPAPLLLFAMALNGKFKDVSDLLPVRSIPGVGEILIGDLNGDGADDAFLAGFTDFPVLPVNSTVILSSASGFLAKQTPDQVAAHAVSLADFDGDGDLDIATPDYSSPPLSSI
jgi:hypothetical protein